MNCGEANSLLLLLVHENIVKSFDELLDHINECPECWDLLAGSLVLRAVERIAREELDEPYRSNKRPKTDETERGLSCGA